MQYKCEEVKATFNVILLSNVQCLHLTQRADKQRGGPFISRFTELLNASWEEREIQRGRVLRKALIITFSFEHDFVPPCPTFFFLFFFYLEHNVITNVIRLDLPVQHKN